jgi:hypothetical protein
MVTEGSVLLALSAALSVVLAPESTVPLLLGRGLTEIVSVVLLRVEFLAGPEALLTALTVGIAVVVAVVMAVVMAVVATAAAGASARAGALELPLALRAFVALAMP